MLSRPPVGVVVPVYNAGDCLSRCVESVLAQQLAAWQLLLADDGSTDGSGALCDAYAARDARIAVIHRENGGASAARQTGVEGTAGEYIAFADSDDRLEPDYLATLYQAARQEDAGLVCCNCTDDGEIGQDNRLIERRETAALERLLALHLEERRFAYTLWGKLIRRELLADAEFVRMRYTEDTYMLLDCFVRSGSALLLPYAGYHYVANPQSATALKGEQEWYRCNLRTIAHLCALCRECGSVQLEKAQRKLAEKTFILLALRCRAPRKASDPGAAEFARSLGGLRRELTARVLLQSKKGAVVLLYRCCPAVTEAALRLYYGLRGRRP